MKRKKGQKIARRPRARHRQRRLLIEQLEDRRVLATFIWDGGGADNLWSTAANWSGDIAPDAGNELVFPVGASQKSNVNDFAADTSFSTILITGSDYSFSGNRVSLADDIKSSGTGNSIGFDMILGADSLLSIAGPVTGSIDLAGHTLTAQNADLQGVISGTGDLNTSGTVSLREANTYTGKTTVSGTLKVYDPQSLGTADGTAATGTKVQGAIQLQTGMTVANEHISGGGGVFLDALGNSVWTGDIEVGSSDTFTVLQLSASGQKLEITGDVTVNGQPGYLDIVSNSHIVLSGTTNVGASIGSGSWCVPR